VILASRSGFVLRALVPREFKFKVFRGSAYTFQHLEGNLELTIAQSADCNGWGSSKPLQHAEIAFRHGAPYAALPHGLFNLRNPVRTLQYFPRLGTIRCSYNSVLLHQIDEMRGAPVANA
jgi:hypothetical protein